MTKGLWHILLFFSLGAMIVSCVYPYENDDDVAGWNLAIDGKILIGGTAEFHLSRIRPLRKNADNRTPIRVTCWIEDNVGNIYRPSNSFDAVEETLDFYFDMSEASETAQYRAHFLERRTSYSYVSEWLTVMKAPHIDDITFSDPGREGDVDVSISMTASSKEDRFIALDYVEGWQFHSKFIPVIDYDLQRQGYIKIKALPPYWCYSTSRSKEMLLDEALGEGAQRIVRKRLISIPLQSEKREKEYWVRVRATSVSEEGFLYLQKLNAQSDFVGDLFTPIPDQQVSNIYCEDDPEQVVLGFIYASTFSESVAVMPGSFFSEPKYGFEKFLNYYDFSTFFETDQLNEDSFVYVSSESARLALAAQYRGQFRPYDSGYVYEIVNGEITKVPCIIWLPTSCFDCTLSGGVQMKPLDWPIL